MTTILETPRLMLREMTLGDLDFVAAMLADPEVMRLLPEAARPRRVRRPGSAAQLDRYAGARLSASGWRSTARSGAAGRPGRPDPAARRSRGPTRPSSATSSTARTGGRGYASEAAAACRDYAFDVLGRPRVICLIRPVNVRLAGRRPQDRPDRRRASGSSSPGSSTGLLRRAERHDWTTDDQRAHRRRRVGHRISPVCRGG